MNKNLVSISEEEYKEYQCLKKGIPYVPPKEYLAKFTTLQEIMKDTNKFLSSVKKRSK